MNDGHFHGRNFSTPVDGSCIGLASFLGVPASCLDQWERAGLIHIDADDEGGCRIDLTDASVVRSLCPTVRGKSGRLRSTLDRLRAWFPTPPEPVRNLTLVRHDGPLMVCLADGRLVEPAGQFRFEFDAPSAPAHTAGRIGIQNPATPREWHERGIDQELAGDSESAVGSYTTALLVGGPDEQIIFDLAHALTDLGETDRAAERYRQVVELDPLRQDAWVNLGDALLTIGQTDSAIQALRRALDLDPDDADSHYNLADACELVGDRSAALLHWQAFVRLGDPSTPQWEYAREQTLRSL